LDPISPELVLVDRELARAERARLAERPQRVEFGRNDPSFDDGAVRRALGATSPNAASSIRRVLPRRLVRVRSLLAPAVLVPVLLTGGILLAVAVVRSDRNVTLASATAKTPAALPATSRAAPATSSKLAPSPASESAGVESKILSLVLRSPARRLPAKLIDPTTGLAMTNLQASCRRLSASSSFLCVIRLPDAGPLDGVYIVYRPGRNGRGSFTWYRPTVGR
jgi:hypothetical protein